MSRSTFLYMRYDARQHFTSSAMIVAEFERKSEIRARALLFISLPQKLRLNLFVIFPLSRRWAEETETWGDPKKQSEHKVELECPYRPKNAVNFSFLLNRINLISFRVARALMSRSFGLFLLYFFLTFFLHFVWQWQLSKWNLRRDSRESRLVDSTIPISISTIHPSISREIPLYRPKRISTNERSFDTRLRSIVPPCVYNNLFNLSFLLHVGCWVRLTSEQHI